MSISSEDRRIRAVRCVLRLVLLVQACGLAAQHLFHEFEVDSDVYSWLYLDHEFPDTATAQDRAVREQFAQRVDDVGNWLYLACGALLFVVPLLTSLIGWGNDWPLRGVPPMLWQAPLLLYMAAWLALIAGLHMVHDGERFAQWTLGAQAARILAPIGLLMLLARPGRDTLSPSRVSDALGLLRFAVAATFVVHGLEALYRDNAFVFLIIESNKNLLGNRITIEQADTDLPLRLIGSVDILVALLLVITRLRIGALYMAFWGFITAASRMTATGFGPYADPFSMGAYGEFLIRFANGGVPLAIFLFWQLRRPSS